MHACGHDVHATWAVGAAALLANAPAMGDVLIVLQPSEETGRGALEVLETGALEGVAAIFGGHVDRRFGVGQIVADDGSLAASADTFSIELIGRGAHAARPHESADPVVGAGALIGALQTIVARRLNPAIPAVVTIGTVNAGTATNVIPDRAVLTGTLRAVDPATRALLGKGGQADQSADGGHVRARGTRLGRSRHATRRQPARGDRVGPSGHDEPARRISPGSAGVRQSRRRRLCPLSGAHAGVLSSDRGPRTWRSRNPRALTAVLRG